MQKSLEEIERWDKYWIRKKKSAFLHKKQLTKLRDFTGSLTNKRTLEIGAGSGLDSIFLAEIFGAEVYCLDFSCIALSNIKRCANKRRLSCFVIRADLKRLPFIDQVFDVALSSGVIEHFRNMGQTLLEQKRVLREKGVLLIGIPYIFTHYTLKKKILLSLNRWPPGWETELSKRQMKKLLRTVDMQLIEIYLDCHPLWYLPKRLRFTIFNLILNGGMITLARKVENVNNAL
jgi:ubiquinone/menaquinone biosynthesis C-methylase UbiE